MEKSKQVVMLMAHLGCNIASVEQKYQRLSRELPTEMYDVFLLFNVNRRSEMPPNLRKEYVCAYDLEDINALGYTPICKTLLPGSCHFPVLKFFIDHPQYSHYWFIEYDVEFTATWDVLMDAYAAHPADFIASHIFYYEEDMSWSWCRRCNHVGYPLGQCLRAFHPICRYSHAALDYIHHYQLAGYAAHSELLIPTCLYNAHFQLLDMGGEGSFVEEGGKERFYIYNEQIKTMRYRPVFNESESQLFSLEAKLFHPVKKYA